MRSTVAALTSSNEVGSALLATWQLKSSCSLPNDLQGANEAHSVLEYIATDLAALQKVRLAILPAGKAAVCMPLSHALTASCRSAFGRLGASARRFALNDRPNAAG